MRAGTLEIELLMNVAKLQEDVRKVEREVGKMTDGVARKTKAVNDNFAGFGRGVNAAGKQAGLASHHMQNLAFQFQDIAIGLQGGQKPLTVFLQQGSQIAGVMGQAGIGVAGLTKEIVRMAASLAGKVGPQILVVGALGLAFKQFADDVDEAANTDKFIQSLGLTADEIKKLENTTVSYADIALGAWDVIAGGLWDVIGPAVTGTQNSFQQWFDQTNAEGIKTGNTVIGAFVGAFNGIKAIWSQLPGVMGDAFYSSVNASIAAINKLIKAATDAVNGFASIVSAAFGISIPTLTAPQIAGVTNNYEGLGKAAGEAWQAEISKAMGRDYLGEFTDAAAKAGVKRFEDRMRGQADELIADRNDKAAKKSKAKKDALDKEAEALKRAIEASTRYAEALEMETSRIGKSAIEIKKMEVAASAARAPTEELRKRIIEAGQAWEAATRAQADADLENNVLQPLRDELALLGLVGPERELAALALEEQAFKARAAKDGITDVNKAWEEYLRLRSDIINGESALEREADAARLLNDQLADMVRMLGNLGGAGSVIGGLLGIFTGQTSAIGGPVGDLLNMAIGQRQNEKGELVANTLGDELSKIFKIDGEFGKTMASLLQGAGTGLTAASAIFGKQSGTEQIGSAIGGALGKVAGDALGKVVGGTLGKALGPLGSIAGGILGSVLGGLFSSTKWGRVNLSAAGSQAAGGNHGASERAAAKAGGSFDTALMEIASQFGGTIGDFGNISLGVRHGDWRVNAGGTSLKKKKGAVDFNEDAEAAIAYAIQLAIERGAITGIREGTQRLLKSTDDLQTNLEKALQFEGVFKELASITDPLGYALDELATQFSKLEDIFAEAGATAEEYAQLEQLLDLKRQEAIDNAMKDLAQNFQERADMEVEVLRLLGREQEALNLARESELAGVKSSLKPLQQMIYTLQDARAVIDQFGPLADSLRAYKDELLSTRSADNFAALRSQFQNTASMARDGDATALAKLQEVSSAYLDAARENAASSLDYKRAVGEVMGAVDAGIFAADSQVEYAQMQIDAVNYNTEILDQMREEMKTMQQRLVDQSQSMETMMKRWEGGGIPLRYDAETPLPITEITL